MDLFSDLENKNLPFKLPDSDEISVEWNDQKRGHLITLPHGNLFYSQSVFEKNLSDKYLNYFLENNNSIDLINAFNRNVDLNQINFKNIKWKQDEIKMYGKVIPLPRLTSWYGDKGKSYSYSGINSNPNEWNNGLLQIKNELEKISQAKFNSVLLNLYRNGEDYLNWHADDEPELGINPTIGSVNFGAERDFALKSNDEKLQFKIPLTHGSVLIMSGTLQHFWKHSVPKRKKVEDIRINLTFRFVK